jgi:hypothetical protein
MGSDSLPFKNLVRVRVRVRFRVRVRVRIRVWVRGDLMSAKKV